MPFQSKKDGAHSVVAQKKSGWGLYVFTALLLAAYLPVLLQLWHIINLPACSGWLDAALLVLATVSTISALARHLPLQNILFAALIIALVGGGMTWLDLDTGIPFGQVTVGSNIGPKLDKTLPWAMPLVWLVAVLNSRGVARLILRPWRKARVYGFRLIALTAVLTMFFDLAFDPFASRVKHYWFWEPPRLPLTWQTAPLVNFLGWAVVTLLILAFIMPILINKSPAQKRPPDLHPLVLWLGMVLLFVSGTAVAGLWPAVALDGAIGIAVLVFAIRGARW